MTATKPLVDNPDSVTHWSCPEAPAGGTPDGTSHHLVLRSTVHRCRYCKRTIADLAAEQAVILSRKVLLPDGPRPEGIRASTVNVHQSILIPDGDIETLIEMAGYGIKYWAEAAHHDRDKRTYTVTLDAEARLDTSLEPRRTLEYNWLAKRLVQLGLGVGDLDGISPQSHVAGYAREYMATVMAGEPDAGIIDADLADVIVQLAYFNGRVIFG